MLATTFGMPIGAGHVRTKMKQIIKKEGLPDVVFHSLRHTSVTYKLKLSGGDIKAVQVDSGHAQADMVTEVYELFFHIYSILFYIRTSRQIKSVLVQKLMRNNSIEKIISRCIMMLTRKYGGI